MMLDGVELAERDVYVQPYYVRDLAGRRCRRYHAVNSKGELIAKRDVLEDADPGPCIVELWLELNTLDPLPKVALSDPASRSEMREQKTARRARQARFHQKYGRGVYVMHRCLYAYAASGERVAFVTNVAFGTEYRRTVERLWDELERLDPVRAPLQLVP